MLASRHDCLFPFLNEVSWQVFKMEVQILKYYNFQLFAPTAKSFLRYFTLFKPVQHSNQR